MSNPDTPTPSDDTRARASGNRWDPSQYAIFGDHRLRPALELLGRIPSPAPEVVYDLGCGPGNVTRIIAERWPDARVVGVDRAGHRLDDQGEGELRQGLMCTCIV